MSTHQWDSCPPRRFGAEGKQYFDDLAGDTVTAGGGEAWVTATLRSWGIGSRSQRTGAVAQGKLLTCPPSLDSSLDC